SRSGHAAGHDAAPAEWRGIFDSRHDFAHIEARQPLRRSQRRRDRRACRFYGVRMIRSENLPPRIIGEGLTFDDVLLVPGHSTVHPRDTRIEAQLTRAIALPLPLIAAAMDTVTESVMAIALAREGGIGIIHKNMSIDQQALEVDRVKRSES